jgi:4-amino-4-deoxy-L-arabinose transferase
VYNNVAHEGDGMEATRNESNTYLILLFVVLIPLFALGVSNHGLWTPDEPRVAEIGREMALSGGWAVPVLNGRAFLEQPPLYYASIAGVFKIIGGASDGTARIPSAVFAFATALTLFFLGKMLFGPRTGFFAAFIMATCGEYFRVAHWVVVDSALTFFVVLSLACFMAAYISPSGVRRSAFYVLCYVSCTLAFFTKGFIGVAIPAVAVLSFLVFDRNLKEILKMHLWLGIVIFLGMTLPWFLALWRQGGNEFLSAFFVHNHLERLAGGSTGHNQPFYYYLTEFPVGFLPWSILVVPTLYRAFRKQGDPGSSRGVLFGTCWFISGFLLLSFASTKRILYLMPIFAPIALLTSRYIETTLTGERCLRGFEKVFDFIFAALTLPLAAAIVPFLHYASRRYGLGVPAQTVVWSSFFSLAALVFSITAIVRHGRDMRKFWAFSAASVFVLLVFGLTVAFPLVDRYKSFVPFCHAVEASLPSSATLHAYKADETLRGVVPFYTGRHLEEIEGPQALEKAIGSENGAFVVVRDKRGEIEREIRSVGRVTVLARSGSVSSRNLVLFRVLPARSPHGVKP